MINLEKLKELMRQKVEEDRSIKSVTVSAPTLDEALVAASIELSLALKRIDYEVVQKGYRGFMGWGRRAWTITAYQAEKKIFPSSGEKRDFSFDLTAKEFEQEINQDATFYIRLWHDGVYLKVIPSQGKGLSVNENQIEHSLSQKREIQTIDNQIVKKAIKQANSTYVCIGKYHHNLANDTMISVDVDSQEMQAFVLLSPPKTGGADSSYEEIEHLLKTSGIVYGILKDDIEKLIDDPIYNQKVLVALGTPAIHGEDAKIVHFFETQLKIKPHEIGGRVDLKELNMVCNVLKGEELAKKIPAKLGVPGHTVTGRLLPAKDGQDVRFELGNNVSLSENGLKVISTSDGQVFLIRGCITVETVIIIQGDVDNSVGNINFLGSIVVEGSVLDGFTVKAVGNIEVMGNVGKATLETQADIIVHQGINGAFGGKVIAGQNLWSKFVQNATIEAGNYVIVSDGILHSRVIAGKKILCKGKRAKIVGGHLMALQEINASSLGAIGSGETLLEVGSDPKLKKTFEQLSSRQLALEQEIRRCTLDHQSLAKHQESEQHSISNKEEMKQALLGKITELEAKMSKVTQQLEAIQKELDKLKLVGKISSSGLVYPGTRIIIKEANLNIIREYNRATFVLDGSVIRVIKYEDIEEEIIRRL